ncbi:PREDICTED: uncharacterized protein LOC109586441 [Amphimedon queenslandica]|uniref:Uncharacterized protein n=1 Tax=Amphimedon queenslandica TaxID=400682 RepID=A0A1X7TR01_AMPQE|nr:PREDICTED: uncharacterized protein LOC109586441 [Amphimedon queenslandica]|eukprot:XP_019858186.1 PREDICTED: uncharacterized protein LOC109586441 [Amphimedon queenslandica]
MEGKLTKTIRPYLILMIKQFVTKGKETRLDELVSIWNFLLSTTHTQLEAQLSDAFKEDDEEEKGFVSLSVRETNSDSDSDDRDESRRIGVLTHLQFWDMIISIHWLVLSRV